MTQKSYKAVWFYFEKKQNGNKRENKTEVNVFFTLNLLNLKEEV